MSLLDRLFMFRFVGIGISLLGISALGLWKSINHNTLLQQRLKSVQERIAQDTLLKQVLSESQEADAPEFPSPENFLKKQPLSREGKTKFLQSLLEEKGLHLDKSEVREEARGSSLRYTTFDLTVTFSDDESFFAFISQLMAPSLKAPGIIQLQTVKVEKERDVTQEALFQLAEGGISSFFKATLTIEWIDLYV